MTPSIQTGAWWVKEKTFYLNLLAEHPCAIFVAPTQVRGIALDRATGNYAALRVAQAVAQHSGQRVNDVELVDRALGAGRRNADPADLFRLARLSRAHTVITPMLGHDGKGRMTFGLMVQRDTQTFGETDFTRRPMEILAAPVAFDLQHAAADGLDAAIAETLRKLNISLKLPSAAAPVALPKTLPESPLGMQAARAPLEVAYSQLVFAALAPWPAYVARDWSLGRALLALASMPRDAEPVRVARARAYKDMGLRPAALRLLEGAQSREATALAAVLNGNQPAAREASLQPVAALPRLLQSMDLAQLALSYQQFDNDSIEPFLRDLDLPGDSWGYFVWRTVTEWDTWNTREILPIKQLMDAELPVAGFDVESIVRGHRAAGGNGRLDVVLHGAVIDHAQRYIRQTYAKQCCTVRGAQPDVLTYLGLLAETGHLIAATKVQHAGFTRGARAEAEQEIRDLEPLYAGNSVFEYKRAAVLRRAADAAAGGERTRLFEESRQIARTVYWSEQAPTGLAGLAFTTGDGGSVPSDIANLYADEWPPRPAYNYRRGVADDGRFAADLGLALESAVDQVSLAGTLITLEKQLGHDARVKELHALLDTRFQGSGMRNALLAYACSERWDIDCQLVLLRENVARSPRSWSGYKDLALAQAAAGRGDEASATLRSYPRFSEEPASGGDAVGLANNAYEAGNILIRGGRSDLARWFLEKSGSGNTGASAEGASRAWLAIMEGDYARGIRQARLNFERYPGSDIVEPYLSLLYESGRVRDADAAIATLLAKNSGPLVWKSALVGRRLAGTGLEETARWVEQEAFAPGAAYVFHKYMLLRHAVIDRAPTEQDAHLINEMALPPHGRGQNFPMNDADAFITLAYGQLLRGEDAKASENLSKTLARFAGDLGDLLPYLAVAATGAHDIPAYEAARDRVLARHNLTFDIILGDAAMAALAGDPARAMMGLMKARTWRPALAQRRFYAQVVLGDVAEILAARTGNAAYRKFALDWARDRAVVEPYESWVHASLVRLSDDPVEKKRAIGALHYLDPRSATLQGLSAVETGPAVAAFRKDNPFKRGAQAEGWLGQLMEIVNDFLTKIRHAATALGTLIPIKI